MTQQTSIVSILVDQGVLSKEQAALLPPADDGKLATQIDNAAVEELLLSQGLASPDAILRSYATLYQVPFVRLSPSEVKSEVLKLIPELVARRYDIAAYRKENDVVYVAVSSPGRLKRPKNGGLLRQLQQELGLNVALSFAPLADIRALHALYATAQPPVAPLPQPTQPATKTAPAGRNWPTVSLLERVIPQAVLKRFPKEVMSKYRLVAYEELGPNRIAVAAINPEDPLVTRLLAFVAARNGVNFTLAKTDELSLAHARSQYDQALQRPTLAQVQPAVPTKAPIKVQSSTTPEVKAEDIAKVADELSPLQAEIYKDRSLEESRNKAKQTGENTLDSFLGGDITSIQGLVETVRSGNIPKTVAAMIALAVNMRSSDIHIESSKEKIRLRYRIDGELTDMLLLPPNILSSIVSRIKILSQLKIDENRIPQDGRFDVHYKGRDIDLRVSTLPTVHGEKVVMRILDKTTGIMSLADMGLAGANLTRLVESIEKPYGIVLATGPTGSGKSTTLYAILQHIAKPEVNVVTLEDPVEYEIPGINQTQIKPKIGFTFAEGLRSILRQDPNIIMVGEVRDKETAEMATHSALTGHLVLSTLHTNNAAGALPRLINMGVEPFLITSSINAIVGQRLVRRICSDCKIADNVPAAVIEEIKQELATAHVPDELKDPTSWQFSRGKECPNCSHGYRGRIGIFEILPMTEQIEALAVAKEPASTIEEEAIKEGMITMKQDGLVKAIAGITTVEEVMKATTE